MVLIVPTTIVSSNCQTLSHRAFAEFKHLIDYVPVSAHANPINTLELIFRHSWRRVSTPNAICHTKIFNEHRRSVVRNVRARAHDRTHSSVRQQCTSVRRMRPSTFHFHWVCSLLLLLFLRAACVLHRPMVVVVVAVATISQCLTIVLSPNVISLIYIRRLPHCMRSICKNIARRFQTIGK